MYRSKSESGRDRGASCFNRRALARSRASVNISSKGSPLRWTCKNKVFATGDRYAMPFRPQGSSRHRVGASKRRVSPGSLSPKSKYTGTRLAAQSRRSAPPSFDGNENASGVGLTGVGLTTVAAPSAMPFCFRFPPRVAGTGAPMRPMPDFNLPALGDHRIAAKIAFAREASLSFSTFPFNDSEFHLLSSQWPIDCSITTSCFETQTHQLFAGSCFSSALARGTLSLVVNGSCSNRWAPP